MRSNTWKQLRKHFQTTNQWLPTRHLLSLSSVSRFSIFFLPNFFLFLFLSQLHNVHVSLPVIYLQLQPLSATSVAVASPDTVTLPPPTCPIFIIIIFIFIISTHHTTRFNTSPGGWTLPLDVGCVRRVINCIFLQGTLKLLHSNEASKNLSSIYDLGQLKPGMVNITVQTQTSYWPKRN